MASPSLFGVESPADNAHVPGSSTSALPTINVQVLGVKIALSRTVRNPLIKLVLDGHTIVKRDFDKNATQLDWMLDVPYIFRDGPSLTVQICEGRVIGKSKVMSQLPIHFRDARNAINTALGETMKHKLNEDPNVVLILKSSEQPRESDIEALKLGAKIVDQRKNVLDHLGRSRQSFETLLSLGTAVSELNPIAKAVLASINAVYNILKEQERCNELALELADDMARTLGYVQDVEQFARVRQFVETLKELEVLLADTQSFIIKYFSQSAAGNALSSATSSGGRQIDDLRSRFERFKHQFDRGLAVQIVQTTINLDSLLVSANDDKVLEDLKPKGLGNDNLPPECMDGTRQDILNEIDEWIADLDAPNILWIRGHPGVGKSAIASSVVRRLREANRLGSCFFFERAKSEVLTPYALWRMVAFDLSRSYPVIRKHLVTKLDMDRNLPTTGNLDDLFRQLIEEPLRSEDDIPIGRLPVIVIDALDECGGLGGQSEQRNRVLRTLSRWPTLPRKFKVIVTGRAEIGRVLQDISRAIEIAAGSSVSPQSSTDIGLFLEMKFHDIVAEFPKLDGWPGMEEIQRLVKQAGGLFIWARVVADFIRDGDPREQLSRIKGGEGIAGGMASLYSHILQISFPKPTSMIMSNFHSILGATILTQRPLPTRPLADLLEIDEISMEYICNKLSSVIEFTSVIQISHQSFTDFLIDQTCPCFFRVEIKVEERKLALACLRAMKNGLKFNICELESSYRLNSEVLDMELRIDRCIPGHLQYACWYWADHLAATEYDDEVLDLLENFMNVQFLYWLEVLSVTRRMNTASRMISLLIDYRKDCKKDNIVALDMRKFITAFASVISQSAPHVYISALPFAPERSAISRKYKHRYSKTLKIEKGGLNEWPKFQNVFHGHTDRVLSIAISPDGRRVASGSQDDTIRIWDAETGEVIAEAFQGHPDYVNLVPSVAFSPDGRYTASGYGDIMRIWDAETGEMVAGPFGGHSGSVRAVTFSPNGRRIMVGSNDNMVEIWDLETGEMVAGRFEGHRRSVDFVAFSPDGRRFASGCNDHTIGVWDAETGEAAAGALEGHTGRVLAVAFSPDNRWVVSGSRDKTVRIWDAETGEVIAGPFEGHTGSVRAVAFSSDGRRVASGSSDKTVRVWDAETGEAVAGPFEGHTGDVRSVAFFPDGRRLTSGSNDKTIRIWDAETRNVVTEFLQGHTGGVESVAFSPDGRRIASGSGDKTIRLWDAETGEAVAEPFEGHRSYVYSLVFSPDGRRIASGFGDKTIWVWDAETGKVIKGPFKGHTDDVRSVAFSPDGRRIASGSDDGKIRVWDAETSETVAGPFKESTAALNSVVFSPDGGRVVSGADDNVIRIWDVETGEMVVGPFKGHGGPVRSVAFSPDGGRIASGSHDKTIRVWDAETGEVIAGPFEGHTDEVKSVAFSPDGRLIASGSDDKTIRVWDAETGEAAAGLFEGHTDRVLAVAFSPDGRRVVSGSDDKTIKIWDLSYDQNGSPSFVDTSRIKEGWILDSYNNHLFWVPPSLRAGLIRSNNMVIIGNLPVTKLNLEAFEHGNSWTKCQASASTSL